MRAIQQEERVRLARIDCLRIAATLEVLSFHCLRNSADHGGTSVLMILAVMLAAETRPGREWKEVLVKRAQRLLLEFYAILRLGQSLAFSLCRTIVSHSSEGVD